MAINGLSLPGFTRRKLFNALATVGLLAPDFDSLKAKWLIFMGLTSKRSITDWCSCRLRRVF